ncbi:MAG: NAD-dependent protein deacetylase [Pseudomonadales bacterium]
MTADLAGLLEHLDGVRRIAVITGAGCSTGSGIGDYRDRSGSWKRAPPVQMQDFVAHAATRRRYWARSMRGWPIMANAQPNAAHRALAELERAGLVAGLITQNVDGLHQRAGHRRVLELHGALATVVCLDCGAHGERRALQTRLERDNPFVLETSVRAAPDGDADLADGLDLSSFRTPDCERCGGVLKPDVVFYGDSVPRSRVADAYALVEEAEVLLVVGSSLMVFSSFRFCRRARELGKPLLAVNHGVTRADDWLAAKLDADCAETLPALAAALTGAGLWRRAGG